MEAVIFIGIPASGKSSFFAARFADSHVRINLDMLRTRHRERLLLAACLEMKQPFVVDNTNLERTQRSVYVEAARKARFSLTGYCFQSRTEDCLTRNRERNPRDSVPDVAIQGARKRMAWPREDEGFDALHYVRILGDGSFAVEDWIDGL